VTATFASEKDFRRGSSGTTSSKYDGLHGFTQIDILSKCRECKSCDEVDNYTRVTFPLRFSNFFAGTQQGNSYGFGEGFYGFGLWTMKFLNIPQIFAGKMPANNILYNIKGSRG
jgi:hypothetical protein